MEPNNLDELWDYDHPAETEAKFRALLPARAANRDDHAQLLTQIARALGLQRKFDEAHQTLDTAEALLTADMVRARVRYLLERGRVFNSSGQPDRAQPFFLEAWERARAGGEDFYAVDAAHMLAIVAPPDQQMAWNLKALAHAEQSADARARNWRGSLYNNIGWTHHDAGEFDEALAMFEKALRFREEQGREREIDIAQWCVARALRSLGRIEAALQVQRSLRAKHEHAGERDGFVLEELGECLLALNRPDEARPHFAAAYEELCKDPWLAANEPTRLQRLKELGSIAND
jgi:tetratricopeptide (TPR) repeat protein